MSDSSKKEPLKKLTQDELDAKIAEYEQWRKSAPPEGAKFPLNKLDLRGLTFYERNLIRLDFSGSDLSGVDLTNTDLTNTDLTDATLSGNRFYQAKLINTKFLNAKMHGANLLGTITAGMQLGGADITNAKLPEEIKTFEGLKTVEEASKITKRLFTMLLSGLGLSILTIFSTRDVALLTNSTTSPLPIIQTPIPLASFYWVAPILLAAFFAYFLLNLLHLYQLVSKLPAIFPDGTALDEKIYPWLLNTLVREHFPILARKRIAFFWLRKLLMVILVFWTTPIILFGFWARYLPRREFGWSYFHVVLMAFIVFMIIRVYDKTVQTLKNDP